MKAILLAAGRGRRLAPMGWDRPKCLLPCPQGTLLDNALAALVEVGIDRIVIVVGFKQQEIIEAASRHSAAIEFIDNPDYDTTNTLYSLHLAREHLHGGAVLLNADVWFDRAVLRRLVPGEAGDPASTLAVVPGACGREEVKVVVDETGRITQIGKDLDPRRCAGEYIGIARFDPALSEDLIGRLDDLARSPDGRKCFYEAALDTPVPRHRVIAVELAHGEAIEIDTPQDYDRAKQIWNAHADRPPG